MKLKIKITKEVLETTKNCGQEGFKLSTSMDDSISSNCAITHACRKLFPGCTTASESIFIYANKVCLHMIKLPEIAQDFINNFDIATPEKRINMKPFEFEVVVSDDIIDAINIDEAKKILQESSTLELIEN